MKKKIPKNSMEILSKVFFDVGDIDLLWDALEDNSMVSFGDECILFLEELSRNILLDETAKKYSDVVSFGFWIRKSSILKNKEKYCKIDENIRLGRGVVFHIAPSNVPVNYAYSMVAGLLAGNVNIVRLPSGVYSQVKIINSAIKKTLLKYPEMKKYVFLVNYPKEKVINDFFSEIADVRMIWGGDKTIGEIRQSTINPRTFDICFSDRYSICVIDKEKYISLDDKEKFVEGFYNDSFLMDQNACTSPRIVIWIGEELEVTQNDFWARLEQYVEKKYNLQPVMVTDKLTTSCMIASKNEGVHIKRNSNYIYRVELDELTEDIMDYRGKCGLFYEYKCKDVSQIRTICDNVRCQTMGYLGNVDEIREFLSAGISGVDRVVPIGRTMDFGLIWDGYNLIEFLTRTITINV